MNRNKTIWQSAALAVLLFVVPLEAKNVVVIIAGQGGLQEYQEQFLEQATTLRELLINEYGYAAHDVILLHEAAEGNRMSRADNIRLLFQNLRSRLTPTDRFILVLIGHGSFDGTFGKLNLPGPDLSDADFADLIESLPTRQVVVINTSSASGSFLQKLAGPGRTIITATRSGLERNATHFAEFWLQALAQKENADLNKDGRLSVLESFVFARDQLVRWYEEQRRLRGEHPLLDGNGDGKGTETPDLFTEDGRYAGRIFIEQAQQTDPAEADQGTLALDRRQKQILEKVQRLQARKDSMPEDQYYKEFEKLMLELAKLNQRKAGRAAPQKQRLQQEK